MYVQVGLGLLLTLASAQLDTMQDLQTIDECVHQADCLTCCQSEHWNLAFDERRCEWRCTGHHFPNLGTLGKRQLIRPSWTDLQHISECSHETDCLSCCQSEHWQIAQDERRCEWRCSHQIAILDRPQLLPAKRQFPGFSWTDLQHINNCTHQTDCLSCCQSEHWQISQDERRCEWRCSHQIAILDRPQLLPAKRQFLGGSWTDLQHISECTHQTDCLSCCQSEHWQISQDERRCEWRCSHQIPILDRLVLQPLKRQFLPGGVWTDLQHISECSHQPDCLSCCQSEHWQIAQDERRCEWRCSHQIPILDRPQLLPAKRQFLPGFSWTDLQHISNCTHQTDCLSCCQSEHWQISQDERRCEWRCSHQILIDRPLLQPLKRQLFLGGLSNIWTHVTELQHCERATATSAECIACCQSAHFTIPLEERGCESLCPITHHSKRQLGDWFHIQDFRHCERDTATTEACLSCCRSTHFTIPLEERQCERLCPITHQTAKRQGFFLGSLGNIWTHVSELQHCERDTATSAECIACCQSAHFTIPLEERGCEALCPITHHSKRQLGDWFHIQDFRHCERDTATTEACLSCCRSTHFTIPLEERQCERLCPITHQTAKRQGFFLGSLGNIWTHVSELQHCERDTATSAECIACCQSAHFTIPLEERGCEALCPITHHSKRQLGDWFHIQDLRHCERDTATTEACLSCCRSTHFTIPLEERQCERLCPITHQTAKRQGLFLGSLGNMWTHVSELQHCERDTATSAECIACCQSAHFTIPLEERGCEALCPITHHSRKRQLGDWFHIQDLRHCERDTATTEACLSCCRSTHFTIPLEERQCERLCPITHQTAKRQGFLLGSLGNIWTHVQEFQHCERETSTSVECISCCQSAHFAIPLEERSCEILCPITHTSG